MPTAIVLEHNMPTAIVEVAPYRSWAVNEKIFSTATAIAIATATATVTATRHGKFRNEMLRYRNILRESWLLQLFNRASINTQNVTRKSPTKHRAQIKVV